MKHSRRTPATVAHKLIVTSGILTPQPIAKKATTILVALPYGLWQYGYQNGIDQLGLGFPTTNENSKSFKFLSKFYKFFRKFQNFNFSLKKSYNLVLAPHCSARSISQMLISEVKKDLSKSE